MNIMPASNAVRYAFAARNIPVVARIFIAVPIVNCSPFWARLEATTAQDVDGGTEVCRAVVSDISERKDLEDERLRFEQELRLAQKADSLARMAGAIAHRFNNQLAVLMGNIELSMGEPPVAESRLTDALDAVRKAAEVSGLLLTYLGQSSGNHAPLDLSETCRRTLPMIRAAMPTGVILETDLPAPGPVVKLRTRTSCNWWSPI
jgi:two-component system cell cycle sensor histidine kinase/response regulator CckA